MRRPSLLQKTFRHPLRLQEILRVLIRAGLSDWVLMLRLDRTFPWIRRFIKQEAPVDQAEKNRWVMLRETLEQLGPTFVKFGQIVSNRSDLLPAELVNELAGLQDDVPPVTLAAAREVVEAEFGKPLEEVFPWFDAEPIASASIAQVHRASLRNGDEVAVKIQRPGIENTIRTDTEILMYLATLVERYVPNMRLFHPTGLVEEFKRSITAELDFAQELRSLRKFKNLFAEDKRVRFPNPFRAYSTRRVLTMQYIRGTKLAEVQHDATGRFNKRRIARLGADVILEQIFLHGFFHADPHPGNILVADGDVICFLDFGITGRLRPQQRTHLIESMLGAVNHDANRVAKAMLGICERSPRGLDFEAFEERVSDVLDEYLEVTFGELDLNQFFDDLIKIVVRFGIRLPSSLMLVTKTLVAIEGVGLNLRPDFNIMEVYRPFTRKLYLNRLRPEALGREGSQLAGDYAGLLQNLPKDARELFELVKTGRMQMNFNLGGLEPLRRTLDDVSYRLVLGIVLGSLMVSSAMIVQAGVPPYVFNVPLIGVVGFGAAGLIGFGFIISLVVNMWRR